MPDIFPPAFTKVGRRVEGKSATWFQVAGSRQTARLVQYGSPSVRRNQVGVTERSAVMLHTAEHQLHDATVLTQLRAFDRPEIQAMGQQAVAMQAAEFKRRFQNLRISALCSLLALGKIYFDVDGNLLPSSSSAVTTIDMSPDAGNLNQVGGIIGTTWATDTVDIIGDITAIKSLALRTTGYPLKHAFYGANILEYLSSNNTVKELLKTSPIGFADAIAQGVVPNGFMGLQWHPAEDAFFADADGSNQTWFGGDTVTYTPEPSIDWLEWFEGTFPVPTNLGNVSGDASGALGSFAVTPGMFSYAKVLDDPPAIKHVAGDTFLPTLKVPNAIFITDVVP